MIFTERIFEKKLNNGLNVTVIEKKDFKTISAAFTTAFGGAYQKIEVDGKIIELPLGVAHFLEHKLFSNEEGEDVINDFATLGLEANAYTDYYNTTYYFNGSLNTYKGIELLLDFVQNPYFSDENVESEKGIIEQELLMYQDMPGEALSLGLMNNLYHKFPFIYDVGGTVEEVNRITKEILYYCYDLFYHPMNMKMIIVGDVNHQEIFKLIEDNQSKKIFKEYKYPKLVIEDEDNSINKEYDFKYMDVVNPKVLLGIKLPMRNDVLENQLLIEGLALKIIKNTLFGGYTKFVQGLLDDKIICSPLRSSYYNDKYSQYLAVGADSNNVDELIKRLKKRIKTLKTLKFNQKEIDRVKKDTIGKYILSFNSIDAIMGDYLDSIDRKFNYLNFIEVINSFSIDILYEKSKQLLDCPISVYIIKK